MAILNAWLFDISLISNLTAMFFQKSYYLAEVVQSVYHDPQQQSLSENSTNIGSMSRLICRERRNNKHLLSCTITHNAASILQIHWLSYFLLKVYHFFCSTANFCRTLSIQLFAIENTVRSSHVTDLILLHISFLLTFNEGQEIRLVFISSQMSINNFLYPIGIEIMITNRSKL